MQASLHVKAAGNKLLKLLCIYIITTGDPLARPAP